MEGELVLTGTTAMVPDDWWFVYLRPDGTFYFRVHRNGKWDAEQYPLKPTASEWLGWDSLLIGPDKRKASSFEEAFIIWAAENQHG